MSPPKVRIGSSIVTLVVLTVTVVPSTCKSPVTVSLLPTVILPATAVVEFATVALGVNDN